MRKKTIVILFSLGFGLSIIASIVFVGGSVALGSTVANCNNYSSSYCSAPTPDSGFIALLVLGGLIALIGYVLLIVAWISILIKQAQRQQWAWFICTLIFGSICMLLWLIIEPEVPATLHYATSGYPPVYPKDRPYPSAEPPRYQDPYRP